ncbi:MAG: hypothetical protein ACR2JQ_08605 [Mycobacteriales bacterium]
MCPAADTGDGGRLLGRRWLWSTPSLGWNVIGVVSSRCGPGGLVLDTEPGWWWAGPIAGPIISYHGAGEADPRSPARHRRRS